MRIASLPAQYVDVAGRRVEFFDAGRARDGDPVIVLLAGAGETVRSWLPVQTLLAAHGRVIAFERSGIGGSEAGSPRTLDGLIAELSGVLDALVPESRVLLVGHSFGALLARVYTHREPERVTGLVMLDATPDLLGGDSLRRIGYRFYVEAAALIGRALPGSSFGSLTAAGLLPFYPGRRHFLQRIDTRATRDWKDAVRNLYLGDAIAEMREVLPVAAEAAAELDSQRPGSRRGRLPVAILTSGTYGAGWTRLHSSISRLYPGSTHELTEDRFHNVHMRHVGLTVQTVLGVLALSRLGEQSRYPPSI